MQLWISHPFFMVPAVQVFPCTGKSMAPSGCLVGSTLALPGRPTITATIASSRGVAGPDWVVHQPLKGVVRSFWMAWVKKRASFLPNIHGVRWVGTHDMPLNTSFILGIHQSPKDGLLPSASQHQGSDL